jgi:hypothetical protein
MPSGQGIGFAIPINLARLIADQLIEKGEVTRGWLGVSIQPLTPELAESFGLDMVSGALVNQVLAGSPAEKAGVKRGDVLLTYDGSRFAVCASCSCWWRTRQPAAEIELVVLAPGKRLTLPVIIVAQQPPPAAGGAAPGSGSRSLGLTVVPARAGCAGGDGLDLTRLPLPPECIRRYNPGDQPAGSERSRRLLAGGRQGRKEKNVVPLVRRGETVLYLAFPWLRAPAPDQLY